MTMVKPFATTWADTKAVFAEYHPDLLATVEAFGPRPPSAFAKWLDAEFPYPGGGQWGPTDFAQVPIVLREMMESADVR